jgi:hypothetical protein
MPFWLHEHKILRFCKSLSNLIKMLVLFALSGSGALVIYFFSWQPYQKIVFDHQNLSKKITQDQTTLERINAHYIDIEQSNKNLILRAGQTCINSQQPQGLIHTVFEVMKQCELVCSLIDEKPLKLKEQFNKQTFVVQGNGEFKNVLQFLHLLETHNLPIKIKHFWLGERNQELLEFRMIVSALAFKQM